MTNHASAKSAKRLRTALLLATGCGGVMAAQDVSLNYDTLSSLEEPLAIEVGDTTIVLRGLLDMPVAIDLDSDEAQDDVDVDLRGNFEVSAQTQLPNRWRAGIAYFGAYETEEPLESLLFQGPEDDKYTDRAAAFVGGSWGTVVAGNVSGAVREETRRARAAGNARLAFDGLRGRLSDTGGGYLGRFGPTKVATVIDEDGDFEVGATFQRPVGKIDHRITARYAQGTTQSADELTTVTTHGGEAVGEVVYGSTKVDFAAGLERLEAAAFEADRWYTSVGARRKIGGVTLSAEGHYGEVDGQPETAAALGAALDIARGLSLNLGVNYEDAQINLGPIPLDNRNEAEALVSLRYSF